MLLRDKERECSTITSTVKFNEQQCIMISEVIIHFACKTVCSLSSAQCDDVQPALEWRLPHPSAGFVEALGTGQLSVVILISTWSLVTSYNSLSSTQLPPDSRSHQPELMKTCVWMCRARSSLSYKLLWLPNKSLAPQNWTWVNAWADTPPRLIPPAELHSPVWRRALKLLWRLVMEEHIHGAYCTRNRTLTFYKICII